MRLTDQALADVNRLLEGRHVCHVALKGSHLLGIAEENADIDLRVVFQEPTEKWLAIRKPQHTIERMDGDLDFVAYEQERFMHHLLKHNGNMIEGLLVPEGYYWSDEHGDSLRTVAPNFLTKQLYPFYRGFAHNQFRRSGRQARTYKNVLYTYREMFMGLNLFQTSSLEFSWPVLQEQVQLTLGWESKVLPAVQPNRALIPAVLEQRWQEEFDYLDEQLEKAVEASDLPDTYDGYEKLNNLLLGWRSKGWR